jgi:hypothetical protein
MLDREPVFMVTPTTVASIDGAPVVSDIVNYWYRETEQIKQDKRCLLDAHLMPFAVKKIGWVTRFDDKEEVMMSDISDLILDDPSEENMFLRDGTITRVEPAQDHEAHIEAHMEELQSPFTSETTEAILEQHIDEHKILMDNPMPDVNVTIQYDAPFGMRWNPRDFLMDPMAQNGLHDARWIAFKVKAPLYHVKANGNYKGTEDLEPTSRPDSAPAIADSPMDFDDFGIVEFWEIWARDFPVGKNKRRNLLIAMVDSDHDKFLRNDDSWPYDRLEDYPCEIMNFQMDVDFWTNLPTLHLSGANNIQRLSNEYLDSMLSVTRKQKNIWLADPMYFAQRDVQNILAAPDGTVHMIEDLAQSQGSAIQPLPFHQIPGEKQQMLSQIHGLFDRTSGTPQPIRGEINETATEVSIAERRNTAREDARGNQFKDFQIRTMKKFWQLHSEFLPDRQILIDPRAEKVAQVDEEIAKGEYRFRIDVTSRAVAKSVEQKAMLDLFNLLVGVTPTFVSLGYQPPNLPEVLKMVLERGFELEDVERFLPGMQSSAAEQTMNDPVARQALIENLSRLGGGGGAVEGQGPGPVNPQQFAAQPAGGQPNTPETAAPGGG